jgi:nucleotide-binding universal stress UspA family protein
MIYFRRIGLAISFSPRTQALLAEAARLKRMWQAELLLMHVGDQGSKQMQLLREYLAAAGLTENDVKIFWLKGKPGKQILSTCKNERIDLLIAGALRKENLVKYYLGTIARKILRQSRCSVLMLTDPSAQPQPFKNIVVNADDGPFVMDALSTACALGHQEQANWLHVVREIKMYGLTMSTSEQCSEGEYEDLRQSLVKDEIDSVEKLLSRVPHDGLKVNIKMLAGKSGFEMSQFARRKEADLIIVAAPARRFSLLDRLFPHDLEYIFADLPCNVLIMHPDTLDKTRKEVAGGQA